MKILIIRFSSIGDVTQALSIPSHIHKKYPDAEIHFFTKLIFKDLVSRNNHIYKIWTLNTKYNIKNYLNLLKELNHENFNFIYDAHNNLRSNIFYYLINADNKLQKPMYRFKRFLLLKFKINKFEMPFSGQRDLLSPLEKWNIPFSIPTTDQLQLLDQDLLKAQKILTENNAPSSYIAIAPSAAHFFKRWPVNHWIELFKQCSDQHFVVLAGATDTFTNVFNTFSNVTNLTGKTTLIESAAIIKLADKVISNDTGLLHFSEQLSKKTIALIGAAPFGFPSRPSTLIIKKDLSCWPCSKHGQGPCVNPTKHKCMTDITPTEVEQKLRSI